MSLELVLLTPVLVLLTLFVLWAGRGGRVALTADLAAEEAATAAAVCCEEGPGGNLDREALVQDMLQTRPGLGFLCVGGLHPGAPPDDGGRGPSQFVREDWLTFDPGRFTGGVGVLGVALECETDGAVAPLRGLFPTVSFRGQASEVVLRQPPLPHIRFANSRFWGDEGETLVFRLTTGTEVQSDLTVHYEVDLAATTGTLGEDYGPLSGSDPLLGSVTILSGDDTATIVVDLGATDSDLDDDLYEGEETLRLTLTGLKDSGGNDVPITEAQIHPDWAQADGIIQDNDPEPYLFVSSVAQPCQVTEGGVATFEVRLRNRDNLAEEAPSASPVTVHARTEDGTATVAHPQDYDPVIYDHPIARDSNGVPNNPVPMPLRFDPGDVALSVNVQISDDENTPEGEPIETFALVLDNEAGARLEVARATCDIIDDEVRVSVDSDPVAEGDPLTFRVMLDRDRTADVVLSYELVVYQPDNRNNPVVTRPDQATGGSACVSQVDYQEQVAIEPRFNPRLTPSGTIFTVPSSHRRTDTVDLTVTTCDDSVVESDERFWLALWVVSGEAVVNPPHPPPPPHPHPEHGAVGIITDNDIPVIAVADEAEQEPPIGDGTLTFTVNLELGGTCSDTTYDTEAACTGATPPGTWTPLPAELAEAVTVDYAINPAGTCSVGNYGTKSDCEANGGTWREGTCSVGAHPTKSDCEAAPHLGTWWDPATVRVDYDHPVTAGDPLSGQLTFGPGTATAQTVEVGVLADALPENYEAFVLRLTDGDTTDDLELADATAFGTIEDVEPSTITVNNPTAEEGEDLVFTVTLERTPALSTQTATVDYRVESRGATYPDDYTGSDPLTGTLTLNPSATVRVQTLNDTLVESDETLHLVLSNHVPNEGSAVLDPRGVGTIRNVNPAVVRVSSPEAFEGQPLVFVVSLEDDVGDPAVITEDVDVDISATEDRWATGTATTGRTGCPSDPNTNTDTDYVSQDASSIRFSASDNIRETSVTVPTCRDAVDPEGDETMFLTLTLPLRPDGTSQSHASLGDPTGVGTINDESGAIVLRIEDAAAAEGDDVVFEVRLGRLLPDGTFNEEALGRDVTVTAATESRPSDTADADVDYTSVSRMLRIPAGETSPTVPLRVPTVADDINYVDTEGSEHFTVVLSGPSGARIDDGEAKGTINPRCVDINVNDAQNAPPTFILPEEIVTAEGSLQFFVQLRLSRPICSTATISHRFLTGTDGPLYGTATESDVAGTGIDLHGFAISAFNNQPTIEWQLGVDAVTNDDVAEDDEWFTFQVKWRPDGAPQPMPSHYWIQNEWISARVRIVDDDPDPSLRVAEASAAEGDIMTFEVALDAASEKTVTVDYSVVDGSGSATLGVDYGACEDDFAKTTEAACTAVPKTWHPLSGRLVIAPGDTSATFTVPTATDSDTEGDETFQVEISAPTSTDPNNPAPPMNATIADAIALGTILEGNKPQLRISDASGDEGSTMDFTVELSEEVTTQVTVDYATVQRPQRLGAATQGSDYGPCTDPDPSHTTKDLCEAASGTWYPLSGTLTFNPGPPGETSKTITVAIHDDGVDEIDETFFVELSNPSSNASLGDRSGLGVINGTLDCFRLGDRNDPNLPVMTAAAPSAVDEDAGTMTVTVSLDRPTCQGTAVQMSASQSSDPDAATLGDDYRLPLALPALAPLATTTSLNLEIIDDELVEPPETIGRIDLSFSLGYVGAEVTTHVPGTTTITDNDQATVSAGGSSGDEGDAIVFTAVLDRVAPWDVTFDYATANGTAVAGEDYRTVSATATIPSGQRSVDIRVRTVQDFLDEETETFTLRLSNATGAQLEGGAAEVAAVGTIRDDDDLPALSISNAAAYEGETLTFTVTLGTPSGRPIEVAYQTEDRTAVAGSDYTAASGTVTIAAGSTSAQVQVVTLADGVPESAERLAVRLSSPPSGTLLALLDDDEGTGVIFDVGERELTVSDASTTEGGTLGFEVGFDGPAFSGGTEITVRYRTAAGTATAGDASAVFTVRLSRAATANVTVQYSTADGNAMSPGDYTAAAGTLTFSSDTTETVSVALANDDIAEDTETFELVLSTPSSNAEIGEGTAVATILDDDSLPSLSVGDASGTEGGSASFTVRLSASSSRDVTVDYAAVADPTAGEAAAVPAQDFDAVSGTLTIAARSDTATVTVALPDDSLDEHNETFWLRLSNPTGATIVDGTGVGAITDDDPLPQLSIGNGSAIEGGTPTADGSIEGAAAVFTVRLAPVSGRTVTVPWTTAATTSGNPATSGEDYTAASGTLTLVSGTTSARIEVDTLEDTTSEADETFLVNLGQPTHATLGDAIGVGAILDDDGLPRVSVADTEVSEDAGPATFTVTLSHASSQAVSVDYATSDGTAVAGDDYATADGARGSLTIPAGRLEGGISVFIVNDDEAEESETFHITLSNPTNAVIAEGGGTATATILDKGTPRLSVSDTEECEDGASQARCQVRLCRARGFYYSYPPEDWREQSAEYERCWNEVLADPGACQEGMCGGDGVLEFAVELSHASTEETSVRYTTFAASAASTSDYVAAAGTLTIPAGDTTASIPVPLVDDAIYELQTETFLLVLDNPSGVELETEQATGTIRDDDRAPFLSDVPIGAVSNENDGFAYHRVTLEYPIDLEASAEYRLQEWSRSVDTSGNVLPVIDSTPGKVTFAPGVVEQIIRVPLFDNTVGAVYNPWSLAQFASSTYNIELFNHVNAYSRFSSLQRGVVWDNEFSPYVDSVAVPATLESAGEAVFRITLNRVSDTAVIATYRTVAGTATAGDDYIAADATVTFPPGSITATVTVPIVNDTIVEDDESFRLEIVNDPRNSNLTYLGSPLPQGKGDGRASVRIIDDDTLPKISVAPAAANENAGSITFWVSLSRASAIDVTVDYATADGTGTGGATAGSDYTATSDTLTIEAGALGASVTVTIIDDTDNAEGNETFQLNLSNASSGATLPASNATATGTIIEDANLPTITISDDVEVEQRDPVIRNRIDFCFRRLTTHTYWVDWRVEDVPSLGDEAATIGVDFLAPQTSGTVTVTPTTGLSHRCVAFDTVPDDIPEHDERFRMVFSNPRGVVLGNTVAWGTIRDEDVPFVTVLNARASEADAAVVFTLQLHAPGVVPASLDYTTRVRSSEGDRAASPGDDYTTTSGKLDIPVGTTTATISVPIIADAADEEHETFLLEFTNPVNLRLRDPVAVGTITDDDDGWTINDPKPWEYAGTMDFTVERDHTSTAAVTLNYQVAAAGSAVGGPGPNCTAGVDYLTPSGSITLQPTDTTATISITLCDDTDVEGRETLIVELTGVPGRKLTGVGTITSDD